MTRRYATALTAVIFLSAKSWAGLFEPGRVYEVGVASMTLNLVAVSSTTVTRVDTPLLPERVAVEIQNIDPIANLWCGPTGFTPTATTGRKITPGSSWYVNVLGASDPGGKPINLYCLSDYTGAATSTAAVIQAR